MKTNRTYVCFGLLVAFAFMANNKSLGQLKAAFASNIQSGCSPLVVAFQDQSTGNPSSWKWSLGNGTMSTLEDPITTYVDPGSYTVKLTIKGSSGQDSIVKTSYITVYANPQVDFKASPLQGCFPLDVNFNNISKAGSGTITKYLWDLGDGNVDTTVDVKHTYTSSGTFDVTLKVTNSYGCYSAITKSDLVQIPDGVNANFDLISLDICKTPATAVFNNTSDGTGPLSYSWDFGDGSKSNAASPIHSYATSGSFNVILTVESNSGCSDTATLPLTISVPTSSFKFDNAPCLNQTLHFTNTSVPAPVSCTWYFGDGTTSTSFNPDKEFTAVGNYTVKLVNQFASGCADSITKVISVATGPKVSFIADDTSRCMAPLTVNFSNKTTGAASNYFWDFGDGDTSSAASPSHTYTQQGKFTVQLTATNSNGCKDVLQKLEYIVIQPIKITEFKNLPDSGCTPVAINPVAVISGDDTIKKYTWDFGDGSTSTLKFPSHTYTKDGFFNVTLSIETTEGCTATYTLQNAVLAGHKPKASFTQDKDTVCSNEPVLFTNTSTNGPITFVRWDEGAFQDPVTGQYYFKNPLDTGFRRIALIVYNYGCADTLKRDSAIYALPPLSRIDFALHCDNKQKVDFIDSSLIDITRLWDFGDGITDTSKNPTHIYSAPGAYTVTLKTYNNACKDTIATAVRIINEVGSISLPDSVFCRGNNINADISGINLANIKNTTWDFGDGTVVTVNGATKAAHAYVINGRFKIKAKMVDKNNCQYLYETKDSITVYGPLAGFSSLLPGGCEDSTILFKDKSAPDGIHNIVKWSWDFGDGTTTDYNTFSAFSHVYKDTGTYYVRLAVTDSYGCTDSIRKNNYIPISKPFASYTISDSIACPGTQISFQNTSSGESLTYLWDLGDGTQNNKTNITYTYKKSGVYSPKLSVTDINGCTDSFQLNSLKIANPVAKFLMSDSISTCPPLEVDFSNKSTDFSSVKWSFGDGSPSVVVSPSHIYSYPGVYPVKLTVNGYGSCADSATGKVTIKGPTGTMSYKTSPVCYPDSIQLTATANNVSIYTWDFSDGNTIMTTKNRISYSYGAGHYVPKLILQDSLGCKVSVKGVDTIIVYGINADASISASAVCDSTPIEFKDLSTSEDVIVHHYWYFGDSTSADQKSIIHTYTKPGTYDAYMIAETKAGCRDTVKIPTPVQILTAPNINIIGDSLACIGGKTDFTAKGAMKDSVMTWKWDFGNGKSGAGSTGETVFNSSGNYTITLKGTNAGGCSDTIAKQVMVHSLPKVKTGKDTSVCQNSTYQFTATGAQTYLWSGPGLSCTNCASPTVKADSLSTFSVTGVDSFGCTGADTITVNIVAPTKINVQAEDTLCIGETTQLKASGALSYQWFPSTYLSDAKSAEPVFSAIADTAIAYTVVGHTAQNCFSDTGRVTIKTFPVPKFTIAQDEIVLNIGSSIHLNPGGSTDIKEWRWSPPQGLSSTTVADPIASPVQTTTYSCIASNGGACIARDQITIRVICGQGNVYIPNTFSPNNDGMNDVFYPRGNGLFKIKSFRVFNRWGQLIFEKFNTSPNDADQGWNGTYNGKPVASDVYVYVIEVLCENNVVMPFKGNITLLK